MSITPRENLCFPRYECKVTSGVVSRKSHASELKNWMSMHSKKKKKKPSVRVELRAGGDPHRSEKPGWSAGDTRQ